MTDTEAENRRAAINDAIRLGGGIVAFRKAVGVTHQAVYYWLKIGYVPVEKAIKVEALTGVPVAKLIDPMIAGALQPATTASDLL